MSNILYLDSDGNFPKTDGLPCFYLPDCNRVAIHFGLLDPNRPPPSGHALVCSRLIHLVELKGALFVYDDTRLFPHAERYCVREYLNARAAADHKSAVGPSKEPEIDIQLSSEIERDPEPIIAPLMMHVEGFKFLRDDLRSFWDHYDTVFGALQQEISGCFDACDTSFAEFCMEMNVWINMRMLEEISTKMWPLASMNKPSV